jgi:hypothetical protein
MWTKSSWPMLLQNILIYIFSISNTDDFNSKLSSSDEEEDATEKGGNIQAKEHDNEGRFYLPFLNVFLVASSSTHKSRSAVRHDDSFDVNASTQENHLTNNHSGWADFDT